MSNVNFYQSNSHICLNCGSTFYSTSIGDVHCQLCKIAMSPSYTMRQDTVMISPEDLHKADKRYQELEDKVRILEEALEEAEAELVYKDAQLNLALELAYKAHDLRENLLPYENQPLLPFGDLPK